MQTGIAFPLKRDEVTRDEHSVKARSHEVGGGNQRAQEQPRPITHHAACTIGAVKDADAHEQSGSDQGSKFRIYLHAGGHPEQPLDDGCNNQPTDKSCPLRKVALQGFEQLAQALTDARNAAIGQHEQAAANPLTAAPASNVCGLQTFLALVIRFVFEGSKDAAIPPQFSARKHQQYGTKCFCHRGK